MRRFITSIFIMVSGSVSAQTQEATQLLLNYEKLRQLEEILDNMYKGYKILSQGYGRIRDIAEGNYSLHQVFLDGLLAVSPAVRDYQKIPQIVNFQLRIMNEQRSAWQRFSRDQHLSTKELEYLSAVYGQLVSESLKNIEQLTMVITASKLRMSDEERLQAIDHIWQDMESKLAFLHYFNNSTQMLVMQRAKEKSDVVRLERLNGTN
jgi:hypothetical protein